MTVQYPLLGQFGRLGNQLFQIAATAAHAWRNGTEPVFPIWETSYAFRCPESWFKRFVPPCAGEPYDPGWNYVDLPYWDDMALLGYLQSSRYWQGYEDRIREYLTPVIGKPEPCDCVIHVRRGDYGLIRELHPDPGEEYYRAAIGRMRDDGAERFVVCSDDPRWCDEQEMFSGMLCSNAPELWDLRTMVEAPRHILANSTFSWWGAYLAQSKHVVMPHHWFGKHEAVSGHNAEQLVEPGWVRL